AAPPGRARGPGGPGRPGRSPRTGRSFRDCPSAPRRSTVDRTVTDISTIDIHRAEGRVKRWAADCRWLQSRTMAGSGSWDRAALVPVRGGEKRAELAALPVELPTVPELFTFMRDAERRFETLKLRIEERTYGAGRRQIATVDVALRHPGHARVVTTEPGTGAAGHNEVWISDGEIV